jgi:hypothetical protein
MSQEGNPAPSGPPGPERRTAPRLPSQLRVVCYPVGGGVSERRQARLNNVSRNGLAVVVDRRWDPGTVVIIELPLGEEVTLTRARVVHATPQLGGRYLVGCVFDTPLNDAQFRALTS